MQKKTSLSHVKKHVQWKQRNWHFQWIIAALTPHGQVGSRWRRAQSRVDVKTTKIDLHAFTCIGSSHPRLPWICVWRLLNAATHWWTVWNELCSLLASPAEPALMMVDGLVMVPERECWALFIWLKTSKGVSASDGASVCLQSRKQQSRFHVTSTLN